MPGVPAVKVPAAAPVLPVALGGTSRATCSRACPCGRAHRVARRRDRLHLARPPPHRRHRARGGAPLRGPRRHRARLPPRGSWTLRHQARCARRLRDGWIPPWRSASPSAPTASPPIPRRSRPRRCRGKELGAGHFVLGRLTATGGRIELAATSYDAAGARCAAIADRRPPDAIDDLARQATRWSAPAERLQRLAATSTNFRGPPLPRRRARLPRRRLHRRPRRLPRCHRRRQPFALAHYLMRPPAGWPTRRTTSAWPSAPGPWLIA